MIISLNYSPKEKTLKKKFGNLPVTYIRAVIDNEEELGIFEKCVKRWNFDLSDSDTPDELVEAPKSLRVIRRNPLLTLAAAAETVKNTEGSMSSSLHSPKIGVSKKESEAELGIKKRTRKVLFPSPVIAETGSSNATRMDDFDDRDLESQVFY